MSKSGARSTGLVASVGVCGRCFRGIPVFRAQALFWVLGPLIAFSEDVTK